MRRLLTLAGLLSTLTSFAAKPTDPPQSQYCNDRFAFCVPCPPGLSEPVESDNADGAVMRSADGTVEVRVWGSYVAPEDGTDLTALYAAQTTGVRVVSSDHDNAGFSFTGLDSASGQMVYQRTVQHLAADGGGTRMLQTLWVSYPAEQAEDYVSYCSIAGRSLE